MEENRIVFMGDFALLRDELSKRKNSCVWVIIGMIDSLLRGTGQVVFANNSISGALIIIGLASTHPKVLLAGSVTGLLGLFVSMLIRDPSECIENGLTVYNPMLIGIVTFSTFPNIWNGFFILLTLVATVFSVYLTRSLTNKRFPCVTVPFNIVEIILLTILTMQSHEFDSPASNQTINDTTEAILDDEIILKNMTHLNWGMIFRGVITSSSQIFATDSVPLASTIYLAILIFSPITAIFSLVGAVIGCFTALGLDVDYESIYSGLWGYNSLLSSAALGGLFLVLNGQTIPLAFVATVFTVLLQYVLEPVFARAHLPILTVPFVTTLWLFVGIRDLSKVFPQPENVTFPEEHRTNFLSTRRRAFDTNPPGSSSEREKLSTENNMTKQEF